ncbi:hypothetical protein S7335_4360 [Synechococcus sp. PCC 7335]|nr:hypothetical protein S7335_4360 [Synechococcus sp. PCC 7335]
METSRTTGIFTTKHILPTAWAKPAHFPMPDMAQQTTITTKAITHDQ